MRAMKGRKRKRRAYISITVENIKDDSDLIEIGVAVGEMTSRMPEHLLIDVDCKIQPWEDEEDEEEEEPEVLPPDCHLMFM